MPQLKNLSVSRNSILPKLELTLENVYSNYNRAQKEISYVPIFPDLKSCTVLTSEAESDGADSIPSKPRKRQRLDHLSQEEKIMRRKMKNRVAAQTARDRKKARMAELEEQVLELETERKMLLLANMNLQSQCENLKKENEELKLSLSGAGALNKTQVKTEESALVTESDAFQTAESRLTDSGRSLEHAEGTGSAATFSLDDAVRLLAADCEDDAFLDVLQQFTEELLQPEDISSPLPDFTDIADDAKCETRAPKVVGTPSKSVESHKELIHFDHIYYKQEEIVSDTAGSALSNSELSTKDCSNMDISSPLDTGCVIEVNSSSEIPVISISESSDAEHSCDMLPFESFPCTLGDEILCTQDLKPVPSPVSSDGGYDSSFSSVSSPCSSAVNPWDDTLSELFPSLV